MDKMEKYKGIQQQFDLENVNEASEAEMILVLS